MRYIHIHIHIHSHIHSTSSSPSSSSSTSRICVLWELQKLLPLAECNKKATTNRATLLHQCWQDWQPSPHTHVRTYIRTHIGGARSNPNGERIVHALICQLSKCRSVVVSACRFGGCCPNGKVTSEAEAGPSTKYNPPAPVPLPAPPPPPGRLALLLP